MTLGDTNTDAELNSVHTESATIKETDIGGSGQDDTVGVLGDELRIGIYPDPHYNEISRKSWGSGSGSARDTLDDFVDEMNDEYKPHFVVVPGDVAHGIDGSTDGLPSESTKISWIQTITDLLESSGGTDGNGLDMPVFYTLGDHTYAGASNWTMSNIYSEFGWSSLSDTYYSFDVAGWHIVVLNTSYSTHNVLESGGSNKDETKIPDSDDPFDALEWLRKDLRDVDGPVCVFGHHPLAYGSGNTSKEFTGNQYEASEILSRKSNALYIHGHSHHSWSTHKRHTGPWGVPNIYINEPEDGEWGKAALNGTAWSIHKVIRGTNFTAPRGLSQQYGGQHADLDAPFRALRQGEVERLVVHNSTQRAGTSGAGTTEVDERGYRLASDTSANQEAVYKAKETAILNKHGTSGIPWRGRRAWFDVDFRIVHGNMDGTVRQGASNDIGQHIGFTFNGGSLKGTVADGSTENTTSQIVDVSGSQTIGRLGFWYESHGPFGDEVHFYWNGEDMATLSSNLPTGVTEGDEMYQYRIANGGSGNQTVMGVSAMWYRQPAISEPYTF